jgi:DDE superfamily endonuclease
LSRPRTREELFNLRHASARNVIERIFGIIKRRFRILLLPPEYSLEIQSFIPPALCALHNFIRRYDPDDILDFDKDIDDLLHGETLEMELGELAAGAVSARAHEWASKMRDDIAQAMWDQYVSIGGDAELDT